MTVGIIGLGIMGGAFAKNLRANGFEVAGSDPSAPARAAATDMGVQAHSEIGPWIVDCNPIILSLLSPTVLHAVATQLSEMLGPDHIVIETGTFSLNDKITLRDILAKGQVEALDCPISGTGAQAAIADLVIMASGPVEAVETCRPMLAAISKKIIYAGEYGTGIKMKFVANHAVVIHNCAAAETLAFATKIGLDQDTVYEMLSSGAGQSKMSDLRMPLMMNDNYTPPTASLAVFKKDIEIIGADMRAANVMGPLFEACEKLYQSAVADNPSDYDAAAVYEVYRKSLET